MRALLLTSLVVCTASLARADASGPLVEQRLFSPHPQPAGIFGYSSAVKGNLMVIGAMIEDGVVPETGAAYVYQRIAGQWVVQARLVAPDGQANDLFGTCASIDGDTIVIGAPKVVAPGGFPAGAAYVFRRVAGQWTLEAKLVASDPTPNANFGFDQGVAISGDTIVVTNIGDGLEQGLPTTGSAYVFERRGHTWTQTARIADPDDADPVGFGDSVSLDHETLVVGAFDADDGRGAAYVFRLHHDTWVKEARLTAADATPGAAFGFSTAIDDGEIAIGAPDALDDAGVATGGAYVFERHGNAWAQTARLVPTDANDGDGLGVRVAIGKDTVAVGSDTQTSPAGIATGSVHVYHRVHHAWTERAVLFPSDGTRHGQFSCSLATDGRTLLVGNGFQRFPGVGSLAGEAYLYDLDD